jgi:uracil phosphoribosyltransferase
MLAAVLVALRRHRVRAARPRVGSPAGGATRHPAFAARERPHLPRVPDSTSRPDGVTLVRHPLVQHKVTRLRDRATPTKIFKELVDELAMLLAYEATADLALEPYPVTTPLEETVGVTVRGKKLTVVPILRAGLGMVEGVLRLVPGARVGHIGLYRDHDTLEPVDYYFKVPADAADRAFLVLDPMLATGGSAAAAVTSLKGAGASQITFMCLVAAPEGIARLRAAHPDVRIVCAAIDRGLNELGYIVPGLGDAGDRLFGTR